MVALQAAHRGPWSDRLADDETKQGPGMQRGQDRDSLALRELAPSEKKIAKPRQKPLQNEGSIEPAVTARIDVYIHDLV